MAEALAFKAPGGFFGLLMAALGLIAAVQAVRPTPDQRRLLRAVCVVPLVVWMFAALLLPPQAADLGVWGASSSLRCSR